MTITANDLQTKGVEWLEDVIESNDAAIITVQGAEKYIVLKIDEYNRMRKAELDFAIAQTKRDILEGHFHTDGIAEHIKRVTNV